MKYERRVIKTLGDAAPNIEFGADCVPALWSGTRKTGEGFT